MKKVTDAFFSEGQFKNFLALFFPLLLMTFSTSFSLFVEKLVLVRFSTEAMEAVISATYANYIFQGACMALAMMAQVCVGRWHGAGESQRIGPGIWQFIWFSFISMLVTVPLSLIYGYFYFQGTSIADKALPYFHFLMAINFLYPLGVSLSSFFLGRSQTRLLLYATLGAQAVKLLLTYLLVLGWGSWIPALGIPGAAIATLISQGGLCLLLFLVFLREKQASNYATRKWDLQPKFFWECVHPGLLRAIGKVLCFACWAGVARLMTAKGGDYLLILSLGGTLNFFLYFLGDAINQTQMTIVSHFLGARNYPLMHRAFWVGTLLVVAVALLISVPLLIFPQAVLPFLFSNLSLDPDTITKVSFGVWLSFALYTFALVPISYVLAFKDTKFSVFMGVFNWINGYLLMYVAIQNFGMQADQFWLVLTLMHGSTALLYLWRMRLLLSRTETEASVPT